ncbi:TPA: ubiquitin-protein ligase E3 Brl2 [Trebouxia sp. C0004]
MKHRRHSQLMRLRAGSPNRPATRVFRPVVPNVTCQTRLSSAIQSSLRALRPAPSPANTNHTLDSSSASQSALELLQNNERGLPAPVEDREVIQFCKRANGEDWLLGCGSYGMVYKGKMGELDVAVKMIQKQHVDPQLTPQQALQVMQQELSVLEALPFHDNVVQLHGSYTQHGNIILVLEYMQGGDLRQALQGPWAASLIWYNKGAKIALDVIKGLHFLHQNRILHRDIKSGNILLSQDFKSAKICDVGLAHIMTNTSLSSSTSSSGGQHVQTTLDYAAPELLLCLRSMPLLSIFYLLLCFFLFSCLFSHPFLYLFSHLILYYPCYLFLYLFFFQFCAAILCIWVDLLASATCDVTTGRADTKLACTHMMLPWAFPCVKGLLTDSPMQATALSMSPCLLCLIALMSVHAFLPCFGMSTVLLLQQHSSVSHAQTAICETEHGAASLHCSPSCHSCNGRCPFTPALLGRQHVGLPRSTPALP